MIIKCPNVFISKPRLSDITIFLAGGITGCGSWQADVENHLRKYQDLILFNPRRDIDIDINNPLLCYQQITWEHNHLEIADHILFWFPAEGKCMITLFELGKCLAANKSVILGCHPNYIRRLDVEIQSKLIKPDIPISDSIDELIANLMATIRKPIT